MQRCIVFAWSSAEAASTEMGISSIIFCLFDNIFNTEDRLQLETDSRTVRRAWADQSWRANLCG